MNNSFKSLKSYCEAEDFKGWDPYDGLNSKLFKALPLKNWSFAKLAWIQSFKRNPLNLRSLLGVPKEYNAKGIGLFLTGYCNLYKGAIAGNTDFGTAQELLAQINFLADLLLKLKSNDYSGSCWGYNFDWQNRVFFQPVNTPTVVATSFCADALLNAYDITQNTVYLETALSACDFIEKDLNKSFMKDGTFIYSYSPLDNSQVYNASLLGARLLARSNTYRKNNLWLEKSLAATQAIVNKQNNDGSWIYGEDKVQNWIDSFHTGFNLECIYEIMRFTKVDFFSNNFYKGLEYYLANFFLSDGTPKYYHNKTYPIDIHSPAQLVATLVRTGRYNANKELAQKVLVWTINNMQDKKGFFYYQLKKPFSSKIPYMRWAQAWMFYAFSLYIKQTANENLD